MTIVYLGSCPGNDARDLADKIDAGSVTHAALIYRTTDGDTRYSLIGREDLTYLIGMLQRVAFHMHGDSQ